MPELPEVETIKRQLKPNIIDKVISEIEILSPKNFIGNKKDVINNKIIAVNRYGKVLVFELAKLAKPAKLVNKKFLNIHFKLSGQILFSRDINHAVFEHVIPFTKGKTMPGNTTRVIVKFLDGSGLFFNDLRKFGWIKISDQPLKPKGIDVLDKRFTPKLLTDLTDSTKRPIKPVLMDQDLITGIGNIYANDSLFLAKIHPQRLANSLTDKEIKLLHKSILKIIKEGVADCGSSGADKAFILPDGSKGNHQRNFLVYQREGEPCLNCKTIIKRVKHNGRSSFFCQNCQK